MCHVSTHACPQGPRWDFKCCISCGIIQQVGSPLIALPSGALSACNRSVSAPDLSCQREKNPAEVSEHALQLSFEKKKKRILLTLNKVIGINTCQMSRQTANMASSCNAWRQTRDITRKTSAFMFKEGQTSGPESLTLHFFLDLFVFQKESLNSSL